MGSKIGGRRDKPPGSCVVLVREQDGLDQVGTVETRRSEWIINSFSSLTPWTR